MYHITTPQSLLDWQQYYELRFTVLREPWGQLKGSEVLSDEDQAQHAMVIDSQTQAVVGVARLQFNSTLEAQVRCVAVAPAAQGKGIGRLLMDYVENIARQKGIQTIILDARENALAFYQSIGYTIYADSYLLFDKIQHWKMSKTLN